MNADLEVNFTTAGGKSVAFAAKNKSKKVIETPVEEVLLAPSVPKPKAKPRANKNFRH